ncbi:MAG: Mannosyl-glycoprotein endo-beta-N-acetylglucosaminidase [Bacteriophage sp.]|nr:MAG: Mannosyl-glycoprotein endo-beta-N-acetylglucosaminidase [Bacteriophage sp.]
MKVIPKLQQGNTIESDNTKVVRPEIHEPIKAKPRQYSIVDLGGEPSNDIRSAAERNRDYWHPIKGAKARFKASMSNETNPLVGIERTILPSAAGAALVTTPAAVVGGALGNMTVDKLTGGWGNWLEDKTGIPSEIGIYTNPGAWYGGAKGYKIGKDKLITKSIKGDADLAWNPINKNHWIFNKEARTPSNIAMATANRITPFLSKVEKLPLKVAAYKAAKRTNGNASVSLQDITDYTGSSILGGGNLEGRNLLAKYIFDENPVVKRMFFNKATSNIKPISRNEARRGFSHGDRYEQLYPGVHNRRYEMSAVVPSGRPLKFENVTEFTDYAGKNPIGKVVGKETEPVMRMGDKEFMTFRQPGTDYIGPIDDVAGHLVKFQMNKGKLRQTSQDMWKFNPADYAKRWNDSPNTANQVRLTKQAALMDKVGRPFILQQSNPIWIEGKSVRNPELVTMAHGGRFDFKKSPLLKKQEEINGKRDMRKKFIKSSRPTYKKRIKKAQQGMRFVSYNPVSNPTIDYTDITNPINPFSEYNYNTTYDKPEALVVPVKDEAPVEEVINKPESPIVTPAVSKPVVSKPVTANSTWKSPYTNRKQWSTELINAYKKAGITNDNAIRMLLAQDALESSWGRSAQGKYNFGNLTTGSSWKGDYVTGNDKNAKGEAIKQKFRSYNSMDEYAADKIQFLKRLYDFDENDDINKFVAKLTGSNKGKRRYAEAKEYANSLRGVYNSFKAGGIIKYQEPAQPIKYMGGYDKRGNMVLPVTNENGMNNVTLPEVTVTPRNINLAGAVDRGRRTVGNMGKEILSATTPLGDIESAKDIYQDARSGNYGQAALGAGLLLLPNFIEKPLKALKRVGKKVVKASNKYPAKNLEVNLNPDRSWNMDKIHSDVDKGTKEAIDFLESDVKKETELYNKELAKRLGYEHFTPYPNGADRARVKVTPDYETITYPNGEFAGRVAFDADPSKDILQYNKHYNLHPTAYHETLHRGYYGMADKDRMPMGGNLFEHVKRKTNTRDFYNFKTKKLLVPENEAPDLETYNYLLIEGETAANTMELGKRLGLQPGQEYPGRQALEQMLKEFSESGNEHAFITKYLNMKHPKRVWNALTGKYFVYPLIGTTLIGGMSYDRNE